MNTRGKLLLMWALAATGLLIVTGLVVVGMILPRMDETGRLVGAEQMALGSTAVYECSRSTGRCEPTRGQGEHYLDFVAAARAGAVNEYAIIWVVHDAPNEWHAFSSVSTHLGCFVSWHEETRRFEDPCGGAKWDRTGTYIDGPAPRNLDFFPMRVENGSVMIDFSLVRGKPHD